jgi:ABC-type multidrug transport system permease subunit
MKRLFAVVMIAVLLVAISGCTAGPNEFVDVPDDEGSVAGFWHGLVQGFISPFTFIISLFSDSLHVYEIHNNGGWYNFGFLLGASIIFGGGGGRAAWRRR